ncbi:AMP-binding protein, partial [Actinocorallia lasiicapitis]
WNATARPRPDGPETITAVFAARAAADPQGVALRFEGQSLTYGELDARSNRLAHLLVSLGVGPESAVAMLQRRGPDVLVSCLAILKAGGCYVPIHHSYPADRMSWVLAETGAEVLLTDRAMADRAGFGHRAHQVVVDGDPTLASLPTTAPDVAVHAGQLAYQVFTSGSTGVPKGVGVAHREVVRFVRDQKVGADPERVLVYAPHAFDASTFEMFTPLLHGGTAVIAPPGDLDAAGFAELFTAEKVTSAFLTTMLFNLIAAEDPGSLAALLAVPAGGEAGSPAAMRAVLAACPELELCNAYGPTETTTYATLHPMRGLT